MSLVIEGEDNRIKFIGGLAAAKDIKEHGLVKASIKNIGD